MQEPLLPMRALQNHLPVYRHLTTHEGLCTPQYLQHNSKATSSTNSNYHPSNSRTSLRTRGVTA
jgi:hypothetical protein